MFSVDPSEGWKIWSVAPLAEVVSHGQVAGPDASLLHQPSNAIARALDRAGMAVGEQLAAVRAELQGCRRDLEATPSNDRGDGRRGRDADANHVSGAADHAVD